MSLSASAAIPRAAIRPTTSTVSMDVRTVATLAVAIVLWGANWPVMKIGLGHVSPLWFSALRFASGALSLLVIQAARRDLRLPQRKDLPFVASIGLLQMMLFTALGAYAMTRLPAGRSAILSYTTPLWVAPASVLFFGEKLSATRAGGIALAVLGVAILVNPLSIDWSDGGVVGANAMLLAASLCWALCILHLRYARSASSAFHLAPWQMLLAAAVLAGMALAVEGPFDGDGTMAFWASVGFVGPVATAFCFAAVNSASARLPATAMSTIMLGVPVTGVAISVAALGEPLTMALGLGSLAIVLGIAINAIPRGSRNRSLVHSPAR